MPLCKKQYCSEPAVPGAVKRYCKEHLAAYKEKRRKYDEIRKTLPDCELRLTNECEGKVGPRRAEMGQTTCLPCEREQEAREQQTALARAEARHAAYVACEKLARHSFTGAQIESLRNVFTEFALALKR